MHEYEHTTWLKFRKEFQNKICVSVENNHLYLKTGSSNIELVAIEIPERTVTNDPLFIAGFKDGDTILIVDGFSDISFEFLANEDSASYITLASVPYERATPVNFYSLLLTLGFSFLICFSFSLLHLSFCIYTFKEHTAMYNKRKASTLITRIASVQRPMTPLGSSASMRSDENSFVPVDEEGRKLLYSYEDDGDMSSPFSTFGAGYNSDKSKHLFIKIKTIVDGIAISLMISTSLNNLLSLIGIVINYALVNQSKLFSQEEYGIEFFLTTCQIGVVFDLGILLAFVAMVLVQIMHPKAKSRRVWLWVVMYGISSVIHIIWLVFCLYFNWFGAEFNTI